MVFGVRQMKSMNEQGDVEISSNPVIKRILEGIKNASSIKELKNGLENLYLCAKDLHAKDSGNKKLLDYAEKIYLNSTDIINSGIKKGTAETALLDKVKKYIASVDNDFWQPVQEAPAPQKGKESATSLEVQSDYDEKMQKIKETFYILDNYNNMDDLARLKNIYTALIGQITDLSGYLSTAMTSSGKKDKAAELEKTMERDLTAMASSSLYFGSSIRDGKFNIGEINARVLALISTVSSMNAIDARINIFAQSGKANLPSVARDPTSGAKKEDFEKIGISITTADLAKINAMPDGGTLPISANGVQYSMTRAGDFIQITRSTTLSADEKADLRRRIGELKNNQAALDYICTMRFGAKGEGFVPAYLALGVKQAGAPSQGDQYAFLANEMLDSYKKVGEYASKTALMYPQAYSALVSSKVDVRTSESLVETRDSFDPFSRLAMFRTVQDGGIPGTISDNLLSQMVLSAKYMPVSTSGLILGSESFFYTLALLPDDNLRQAVFNQAAMLISNMYANSTNKDGVHQNYSNASRLMKKFEDLGTSGTLVSDLETRNFYGLEGGQIGVKTSWQDIRYERSYDMSTLESFARSTLQPTALMGWSMYTPQVYPGSRYTPTNAKFIFDQAHGEKMGYLKTMPSARSLTVDYSPNSLEMQASYGMIIGKMGDAYNGILKEKISKLRISSASGSVQGSGTSQGGKSTSLDAQAWMQGYLPGQNAYLEGFQKWSTTVGSKYAPGQFSKFDQGTANETFLQAQANQMNILGTNIWQGYLNYNQNKQANLTDDNGNPTTVGGMKDEEMKRQLSAYLNSTFLMSRDGTMLVNITESRDAKKPVATPVGAGKETEEKYDIDIYVKKGNTWDHTILKGRSREYQESIAGESQTVKDAVSKYFTQLYSELGKRTTIDAAVEVGRQKYDWDKNKTGIGTDNRMGVMLIIQPGIDAAVAGGMSTTGDAVVAGALQSKAGIAYGGFYSFSDLDIAQPATGNYGSSYRFGINNYYMPSYELDEKQPKATKDRIYVGEVTWLAVEKFRASVFGGWKTSDKGIVAGEDFRLKNANVSSFMSFDSKGHIMNGIVSAGGKTERVFGMDNVNLRGHAYALQALGEFLFSSEPTIIAFKDALDKKGLPSAKLSDEDAAAIVSLEEGNTHKFILDGKKYMVKMKEGMLSMYSDTPKEVGAAVSYRVGKGTMTITCNIRPEEWGRAAIDDITLKRLVDNSQSIVDYVNLIPAETLLDLKLREPVMRDIRDRIRQVIAEAIMLNPTNDLYKSFLTNVSVGYRDANMDWTVTASTSEDSRTFLTGMFNYKDKIGVIGGYKFGGSEKPEGIDWLVGTKIRPGSGNTAFSIYVSATKDKRIIGNADFANKKLGAAAVSVGKDYYRVHALVGPEKFSGIVNVVSIGTPTGTVKGQEYGIRAALWAPVFLTAMYGHTQLPGMSTDLLQNALYATANQYSLFPDKIDMDSFQADLYFKTGKKTTFSLTGQMYKMRGNENPWDFYFGGKFIWNP